MQSLEAANRALCEAIGQPSIWCNHGDNRGELFQVPKLYEWAGMEMLIEAMRAKDWRLKVLDSATGFDVFWKFAFNATNDKVACVHNSELPSALFLAACAVLGIECKGEAKEERSGN